MGLAGLKERAEEFQAFVEQNLDRHFRAEEQVLFPSMRADIAESAGLIDDLLADHSRLRALLPRLENESDLAKVLFDAGDLLERHIRREERELFPMFEKHADAGLASKVESQLSALYG